MAMATPLYIFATFTIILALPNNPTTTIAAPASPNSNQVTFKLIHRESIHSRPHNRHSYNTSEENEGSISMSNRIMKNSIPHFQRIVAKYLDIDSDDDAIETDIVPSSESFMFLVNLSIGQPPISQLLIMDSGSSLLWVQCGTDNAHHHLPIFDPKNSSTFASLPCTSDHCIDYFTRPSCDAFNQCTYTQRYLKGAPSTGILATEQLTLDTSDQGIVTKHNMVFGCSLDNGNFGDGRVSGVLGLGYRPIISLVSRSGSMFSYCIGNIFDTDYKHNKLVLGNGNAKMEGDSTSLQVINGHYFVDLQGISVGEKRLGIDPSIFELRGISSGVIIDSGSPATWLVQGAYETLRIEVEKLLDVWLTRVFDDESWPPLCYQGVLSQDLVGFPAVTFHFGGGADMVLDVESLFFQRRAYEFCMAILPSKNISMADLSLIGLMAQQNYNLGYDIQGNKLYIQRIDCQLLDD